MASNPELASLPQKRLRLMKGFDAYPTIDPVTPVIEVSQGNARRTEALDLLGITEQLIHAHTPELGLSPDSTIKTRNLLEAAEVTASLEEDPSRMINTALGFLPKERIFPDSNLTSSWYHAAKVEAIAGNFDAALSRSQIASRKASGDPWPVRDMIPFIAKAGGDPDPFIEMAVDLTNTYKPRAFTLTLSEKVSDSTQMSAVLLEIGRDPEVWLKKSIEDAEGLTGDSTYHFGTISNILGSLGRFDEAAAYIQKIQLRNPRYTKGSQLRANAQLAYKMFDAGLKDEGLALATKNDLQETVINMQLKTALENAVLGKNIDHALSEALTRIPSLQDSESPWTIPPLQSILHSRIGRIAAIAGQDPEQHFTQAIALAEASYTRVRSDAFAHIVRDMTASGIDSTLLHLNAVAMAQNPGELEDLHEAALDNGNFVLALMTEELLPKFRREDEDKKWDLMIDEWEIHFMLDRARALALHSYTPQQ